MSYSGKTLNIMSCFYMLMEEAVMALTGTYLLATCLNP